MMSYDSMMNYGYLQWFAVLKNHLPCCFRLVFRRVHHVINFLAFNGNHLGCMVPSHHITPIQNPLHRKASLRRATATGTGTNSESSDLKWTCSVSALTVSRSILLATELIVTQPSQETQNLGACEMDDSIK